ncbi:hypothetical protein NEHOM01_2068 [Nematocida homosporus]|uniref:uncharacterized protein n=1 Tax=Nematocida homosporus TaxID=1912981 RepID=UPI002220D9A7|nr:uncharacterized protein NEHOM01_2068 [Nematocida homosporus]KAI5187290.1 hypothetical protein NEHOM01_2068 [Nematocida homosporus]
MKQYQAIGKMVLSTAVGLLMVRPSSALAMGPSALGPGPALPQQLCAPEFMKGAGVLGAMGINGLGGIGGGYRMGSPTFCIKPGQQQGAMFDGKISPALKKFSNLQALTSLLNLQAMDCKTKKVNPKTQACFLYKSIAKKAREPNSNVSTLGNTLVISKKGRTMAMVVVERFGRLSPKKEEKPTFEKLYKDPGMYTAQFNEFDDVLKRIGRPHPNKRGNKCAECLNSIKTSIAVGDVECECEDAVSISLDDLKGSVST